MKYDFHSVSLASLTAVSDLFHFLIEFFIPDVKNIKRVYIFCFKLTRQKGPERCKFFEH